MFTLLSLAELERPAHWAQSLRAAAVSTSKSLPTPRHPWLGIRKLTHQHMPPKYSLFFRHATYPGFPVGRCNAAEVSAHSTSRTGKQKMTNMVTFDIIAT